MPAVQWGWSEILANKMVYYLETLVWQKTKDAQKKLPQHKPRPFVPDFMGGMKSDPADMSKGVEAHTTDEIGNILAMPRV